jgi:hypothetical protein
MTGNEDQVSSDYRDFIDSNFKQEGFMIIRNADAIEYFTDSNYSLVLTILREKPMSVKEITLKYNQIIEEKSEKLNWTAKEKESRLRTDKTLYRYIKDLLRVGLIVQAGQRVVIGRTITEALFARAAVIFYSDEESREWWRSKAGDKIVEKTAELLALYLDIPEPSFKCLKEIIMKIVEYNQSEFFKVFEEKIDRAKDIVYTSESPEIDKAIHLVDIILAILKSSEYEKELKDCLGI